MAVLPVNEAERIDATHRSNKCELVEVLAIIEVVPSAYELSQQSGKLIAWIGANIQSIPVIVAAGLDVDPVNGNVHSENVCAGVELEISEDFNRKVGRVDAIHAGDAGELSRGIVRKG